MPVSMIVVLAFLAAVVTLSVLGRSLQRRAATRRLVYVMTADGSAHWPHARRLFIELSRSASGHWAFDFAVQRGMLTPTTFTSMLERSLSPFERTDELVGRAIERFYLKADPQVRKVMRDGIAGLNEARRNSVERSLPKSVSDALLSAGEQIAS